MPLLKPHNSADDLLDSDHRLRTGTPRPTPDLLINGGGPGPGVSIPTDSIRYADDEDEDDDDDQMYGTNKFPNKNGHLPNNQDGDERGSVYDNYELVYKPPSSNGPDALRRLAFLRSNNNAASPFGTPGSHPHLTVTGGSLPRPSSVCSEPRGSGRFAHAGMMIGTPTSANNPTDHSAVVIPRGYEGFEISHSHPDSCTLFDQSFVRLCRYVTLPRRSLHHPRGSNKHPGSGGADRGVVSSGGIIKYDNLGK